MASPTQDMIDTYMSITGASHSLAIRKLEEYGGNLSEAVNAHFGGGYRDFTNPGSAANPQYNFSYMDGQNQVAPHAYPQYNNMSAQNQVAPQGLGPLLSAARSFRPSLLFDPNYSRDLFNRITGRAPLISQPGAVPGVPVEFNRGNDQPHLSGQRPPIQDMTGNLHGSDVEEEMIRAAIEASKQDAQKAYLLNMQSRAQNVSPVNGLPDNQIHLDNSDFNRAVSLSLKTAEREKAMREQQMKDKNQVPGTYSTSKWETSMHQDGDGTVERKQASQELKHDSGNNLQQGNLAINSEELGGISSKELDEAILLENALFGESSYAPNFPSGPSRNLDPNLQPVHGPSSSALTRQLLREQQDCEYLASLLADKEKEMNGVNEVGTCDIKDVGSDNKKIDSLELESRLAAKGASLPCEPAIDDQNAVTLLVRMPNGTRLSRRFNKSDKLQVLFDFIDVGREVKPGTYRVVRSYPRRAFTVGDSILSLSELGLTNKQEALFLELI
ncbi:hypothetical protein ACFX2I_000555 [Malus domestica]